MTDYTVLSTKWTLKWGFVVNFSNKVSLANTPNSWRMIGKATTTYVHCYSELVSEVAAFLALSDDRVYVFDEFLPAITFNSVTGIYTSSIGLGYEKDNPNSHSYRLGMSLRDSRGETVEYIC